MDCNESSKVSEKNKGGSASMGTMYKNILLFNIYTLSHDELIAH